MFGSCEKQESARRIHLGADLPKTLGTNRSFRKLDRQGLVTHIRAQRMSMRAGRERGRMCVNAMILYVSGMYDCTTFCCYIQWRYRDGQ